MPIAASCRRFCFGKTDTLFRFLDRYFAACLNVPLQQGATTGGAACGRASELCFSRKWSGTTRVLSGNRRASGCLWRAISVHRVSHKNASAKQGQDCRDRFNHLTHPWFTIVGV
jgi:hypothetical protein